MHVGFSSFKITNSGVSAIRMKTPSTESVKKFEELYEGLDVNDLLQEKNECLPKGMGFYRITAVFYL